MHAVANAPSDRVGLVEAGFESEHAHRHAGRVFGDQILGLTLAVVTDQATGDVQDRLGAAVIALERDDAGIGEILLEVENISDVRAPPGIDRLVRVAYHAEVRVVHG